MLQRSAINFLEGFQRKSETIYLSVIYFCANLTLKVCNYFMQNQGTGSFQQKYSAAQYRAAPGWKTIFIQVYSKSSICCEFSIFFYNNSSLWTVTHQKSKQIVIELLNFKFRWILHFFYLICLKKIRLRIKIWVWS